MSNDVSSWIWFGLYTAVLLALAGYGFHRLTIIYLYFRHGRKRPMPAREFKT
ncbi:MAG: hypothetical protein HN570_09520, partial [Verrucomicrobia bacterium]|nr:hypothetical protein [Verrucomicrobiota bacterium]